MSWTILNADARNMPLKDKSVQCVVTSPPYWGLRDYGTATWIGGDEGCDHKEKASARNDVTPERLAERAALYGTGQGNGSKVEAVFYRDFCAKCGAQRIDSQIGLEKTPQEYVEKIVAVFREVKRVLRDDGVIFVNLGDSYASAPAGNFGSGTKPGDGGAFRSPKPKMDYGSIKMKDLVGIPWRVAFALQADGWYLRSDIIWCLSGGTWLYVKTQKGEMPMMVGDMARLDPATVSLWNGSQWTNVLGWNKSERQGSEIELVLRSGERISCTPTHKWPTERGLLPASELRCGDVLKQAKLPEPEQPREARAITRDVAWLLGLYLAEGSRSEDTIQISGHADEIERVEHLRKIVASFGGSLTFTLAGNKLDIRIYSRVITAIIDDHVSGLTALDKALKVRCWSYSNEWLRGLLDGYLEGDGHWEPDNNRWRLGFCRNYNLERDLRVLAARLGASLTLNLSTATNQTGEFPSFRGELRFERSGHWNEKPRTEIIEIRKSRCREVYDIGVEDDPHVFALASGVLTHNSKPNPMPESVTDRPTKAHEYIFLLSKNERYFWDGDAVKEIAAYPGDNRGSRPDSRRGTEMNSMSGGPNGDFRNIRTVWTIATQPYAEAHFATFPEEIAERCIKAGTSEKGCCAKCGKARERVTEKVFKGDGNPYSYEQRAFVGNKMKLSGAQLAAWKSDNPDKFIWQPACKCNADSVPCTVLDPFSGAGTTTLVADKLGRRGIGLELKKSYCDMAERRCYDDAPLLAGI